MSRLDSFIRRLKAQRACLDLAISLVGARSGPVLELGLGNGRTFDHLRERMPDREIFVFDRQVAAHPDSIPDAAHMLLGEIQDTLPDAVARISAPAVLAHCDIGGGDKAASVALAAWVAPRLARLLAPGAIVVADQVMEAAGFEAMETPEAVAPGRYHMYVNR